MIDEVLGRMKANSPKATDVLFGRGGYTRRHPGNKAYLELVLKHEMDYRNCKRKYQKLVSLCIIHSLRVKGARFMRRQPSGLWQTVSLSRCREKISQRLRERIPAFKQGPLKPSKTTKPLARTTKLATISLPGASNVSLPVGSRQVVVTDASSDEDDTLFALNVSFFSVEDEEQDILDADSLMAGSSFFSVKDEEQDILDTDSLMVGSFDDRMFEFNDGATFLEPPVEHLARIEIEGVAQAQRTRQKRDDDDDNYSYGTVIEWFHCQEESPCMDTFGHIFPANNNNDECNIACCPTLPMADLDEDEETLLEYFLF